MLPLLGLKIINLICFKSKRSTETKLSSFGEEIFCIGRADHSESYCIFCNYVFILVLEELHLGVRRKYLYFSTIKKHLIMSIYSGF